MATPGKLHQETV